MVEAFKPNFLFVVFFLSTFCYKKKDNKKYLLFSVSRYPKFNPKYNLFYPEFVNKFVFYFIFYFKKLVAL